MNQSRYFIPYNNMLNSGFISSNYMVPRGIGLFGRIGNTLRNFNWSGLLNNANKIGLSCYNFYVCRFVYIFYLKEIKRGKWLK